MTTDTIVRVDPKTLLVGANVRKEITLPADFVASVKEHGVKIPIVAHESAEGLVVVDGQMRTLAALDVGLDQVPVFVRAASEGAETIVDQLIVNRERTGLTRADTFAAVKQLALDFKMPAAAVSKKVGIPKKQVEQVMAIAGNASAVAALEREDVSLELAAKIADAGLTKAEAKQVVGARWNPEHALQEIIDAKSAEAARNDLEAAVAAEGVRLAAKPTKDDYNAQEKNKHLWLDQLVDKEIGKAITPAGHEGCPGHAAWVGKRGYRADVEVHLICTDPSKYGHRDKNRTAPTPLTEADKAARAANSAAAKVWPSIVEVRQTWIREQLLTRRGNPFPGWERLESWIVLEQAGTGGSWDWGPLAAEYLGVTDRGYNSSSVTKWLIANPTKITTALVAVAIAKIELTAGVSKTLKGWHARMIAEYLELLASWGYGLSELEQSIVDAAGKKTA